MSRLFGIRTLAIAVGAVAAFAVIGFAASFTINNNERIVNAEGEALVVTCDPEILVHKIDEWRNPAEGALPGAGGFYVKEIQLHLVAAACNGNWVTVVLTGANGQKLASASELLPSDQILNFQGANVKISDLHDIHVLFSAQQPAP